MQVRPFSKFRVLCLSIVAAGTVAFLVNFGGWRALVMARLFRVENYPVIVPRPEGFLPQVPAGFKISIFAKDFESPRWLTVAPDGSVFVADSAAAKVIVLRPTSDGSAVESRRIFADGLSQPFGIAIAGSYVYVANTNEVVRFRYDPLTSQRRGAAEHVLDLPGLGYNQHWTRSLAFGDGGEKLFISVGSQTNESIEADPRRAAILVAAPDGSGARVYASGLRNAVGIAVNPQTQELWATVNERDNLGDDIPSDYVTHVIDGGFYGWPYSYLGSHIDNRVVSRPDIVAKAIVPDVLLGAHVAPLQFAFYTGNQFPAEYQGGAFIAEHGSWNRRNRSGYAVVFVPFHDGRPAGPPSPFITGFITEPTGKQVYGRPVGVAVALDGSLLISDDGSKVIWRVAVP
jgi:glucose/arabinose dehydrogenase